MFIDRAICWTIGHRWQYVHSEWVEGDKYKQWHHCQRCHWYAIIDTVYPNEVKTLRPFGVFRRLRSWLGEIGVRWHSQNLNDKPGGIKGPMWRHGRGWLYFGWLCFGLEWSLFRRDSTGISLALGGEEELHFNFGVSHIGWLYFSINRILPLKIARKWDWWDYSWGRDIFRIMIHDGTIWFNFFHSENQWSKRRKWQEFNFHYIDFVFGRSRHSSEVLETGQIAIAFPEGNYKVAYSKELHTWKRARGKKKQIVRFDLNMDANPIPVPGKGENSWDIDDDAICSSSVPAGTLQEAIGELTESVYRSRIQYGGTNWVPNPTPRPAGD